MIEKERKKITEPTRNSSNNKDAVILGYQTIIISTVIYQHMDIKENQPKVNMNSNNYGTIYDNS